MFPSSACAKQPLNTNRNLKPQTEINLTCCRILKNNKLEKNEVLVAKQQYKALSFTSRAFSPPLWTRVKEYLATGIYFVVAAIDIKLNFSRKQHTALRQALQGSK